MSSSDNEKNSPKSAVAESVEKAVANEPDSQEAAEKAVDEMFERVKNRDSNQEEFLQAVHEVLQTIRPLLVKNPQCVRNSS